MKDGHAVKLNDNQYQAVKEFCRTTEYSITSVVRDAVADWLDKRMAKALDAHRKRPRTVRVSDED